MITEFACSCATGNPNLGQPGCIDSFSRDLRLIFMNIRATDGTFNQIIAGDFVADSLPEAFIVGKINDADESKQWNITEILKDPEPVRAEPITEEVDNVDNIVTQGSLKYTGIFYGGVGSPQYAGKLNAMSCQSLGFLSVDVAGNIKGKYVDDGTGTDTFVLRPRRVERNTLNALYNEPTKSTRQRVTLTFTVGQTERDGNLRFIPAAKIGTDMTEVEGVKFVNITTSNVIATAVDFNMVYDYGGAFGLLPHKGVVDADVVLFNDTTSGVVAMTVVENDDDGNYTGTFVAQTALDDMQLSSDQNGVESNTALFEAA